MRLVRVLFATLLAWPVLAYLQPAFAQDAFPARPIRVLVEQPAGSIIDIWARRYAQRLQTSMGVSVVVENRPGASGTIAGEALARSAADGYTILYGGFNAYVSFPGAGGTVRYDPARDVTPIALGLTGYPTLVVGKGYGETRWQTALAKAKTIPGGAACGTAGVASAGHYLCELLSRSTGGAFRSVHYKSPSAATLDAANGVIEFSVDYYSPLLPMVRAGQAVPIAVFGPQRLPGFPDTPTAAELGLAVKDVGSFQGVFVPAGTPIPIQQRLNAEFTAAMKQPQMGEWLAIAGGSWQAMSLAEIAAFVRDEQEKWKKMSAETGIRVEP